MEDFRRLLVCFKSQMPAYIHFINIESFYFYMSLAYPKKYKELTALMDVIEPFMPLIVSSKNMGDVILAYEQGDDDKMTKLEKGLASRSKFIFMNTAMAVQDADWKNIVAICRKIREMKAQN